MALALKPTTVPDLAAVRALEADAEVGPLIIPWTEERHRSCIEAADEAHLLVVDEERVLGFVLLAGLSDEHRGVELRRIVIGERGKGIGRTALELVLEEAFSALGAHRVWLDVKPGNERARRAYAAVGFLEEGVLRDALRTEHGYESLILMSILAPEWEARQQGPAAAGENPE